MEVYVRVFLFIFLASLSRNNLNAAGEGVAFIASIPEGFTVNNRVHNAGRYLFKVKEGFLSCESEIYNIDEDQRLAVLEIGCHSIEKYKGHSPFIVSVFEPDNDKTMVIYHELVNGNKISVYSITLTKKKKDKQKIPWDKNKKGFKDKKGNYWEPELKPPPVR
jgi:hypothetical protein